MKTCDEHIISWENGYLFISSSARILIIFYTFLISLSDELWNKHETAAFSLLLHIYTKDHKYILRGPQKYEKSSIFSLLSNVIRTKFGELKIFNFLIINTNLTLVDGLVFLLEAPTQTNFEVNYLFVDRFCFFY